MPITYYNPNQPRQDQYNRVITLLANFAMQRAAQKARLEELREQTTAREKLVATELQAKGFIRPTKGEKKESVKMAGVQPTTVTGKVDVNIPAEKPDMELAGRGYRATPQGYRTIGMKGNYYLQMDRYGKLIATKVADTSRKQAVKGKDFFYTFDPNGGTFERTDIRVDKSGNKYQRKTKYIYDEKEDVVWAQDFNYDPESGEMTPLKGKEGQKYRAPKNIAFDLLKFMLTGQGGNIQSGPQSGWDGPGTYQMKDGSTKLISTEEEYKEIFSG